MKPLKQILSYTQGLQRIMFIIVITSIIGSLLALLNPFIIKFATDWVTSVVGGGAEFSWVVILMFTLAFVVSSLLQSVIGDVGGYFGDIMAIRTRYQLSTKYYEHVLKLPLKYFDNEITGKIINRLSRAISEITGFLQFFSNNLFQTLLTVLITIVVLAIYSWQIALLFILLIPAGLYLTLRTSGPWQKLESEKNKHFDIASGRFAEVVSQSRLVKSFNTEKYELDLFSAEMEQMIPITKRQSRRWHYMSALRSCTFGIITGIILGILFYKTSVGQLTIGDVVMLVTLIIQVSFPIYSLSFFVDRYQKAVANSRDYIEALSTEIENNTKYKPNLKTKNAKVEFKNVAFKYANNKQVLNNISFTIDSGQKVALVGESGVGKTTISNMLMGLYSPAEGGIFIDGINLNTVSNSSVRASIATVFQDASLFSGTIKENIAYANPKATDADIINASKIANAHEFIVKFENGYNTEIGERGIKLSGGQKQRISIARAVLKDAPILILDEATSSLDSKSEREVQKALDKLMHGRTTLIIAHRLSTIANVDTIVTLKNGTVDEMGKPADLATTNGIYSELLQLQNKDTVATKHKLAQFDILSDE